jgi:preprotein translocase subunit SecA
VIGWRGLAQRDPLNEYKSEAFDLFKALIERWHEAVTSQMMRIEVRFQAPEPPPPPSMQFQHPDPLGSDNREPFGALDERLGVGEFSAAAVGAIAGPAMVDTEERNPKDPSTWGKVGRNEACPCGSGKKYKHCHGALA